jgi:hypothetical protein
MRFERKHAALLLGVAGWNVVIWLTFARNLAQAHASGEDRPTGYWVAHTVLIVVDLLIAGVLGRLGWRAWRASGRRGIDEAQAPEVAERR